ncbi:GL10868 [Drosophila persimilis]|uniref:GL10868 n=1 Tax=Drosophila persimilis TaxID=7234 RepID=B4GDD4_DROPE|nr:GL10868 [Drosophila persimilis]
MHSSWAALRAKVVGPGMATGTKVPGFVRAMHMSDNPGLVNHRTRMLKSQPRETSQSQALNRPARYDDTFYKPVCYRKRVYERTWPEYELEEEIEEPPKPATDRRDIEGLDRKEQHRRTNSSLNHPGQQRFDDTKYTPRRWSEQSYQATWQEPQQPKAPKRHHSQRRGEGWTETRNWSR